MMTATTEIIIDPEKLIAAIYTKMHDCLVVANQLYKAAGWASAEEYCEHYDDDYCLCKQLLEAAKV